MTSRAANVSLIVGIVILVALLVASTYLTVHPWEQRGRFLVSPKHCVAKPGNVPGQPGTSTSANLVPSIPNGKPGTSSSTALDPNVTPAHGSSGRKPSGGSGAVKPPHGKPSGGNGGGSGAVKPPPGKPGSASARIDPFFNHKVEGPDGFIGPEFPQPPTCQIVNEAPRDTWLTWYGVQTDNVVDWDMYLANAKQILTYMYNSPLNYSGIFLHLDPPTAPTSEKGANFSSYINNMARLVASIPIQYRVGFHAVVEQDATWQISLDSQVSNGRTQCANAGNCTAPGSWQVNGCPTTETIEQYSLWDYVCPGAINGKTGSCASGTGACDYVSFWKTEGGPYSLSSNAKLVPLDCATSSCGCATPCVQLQPSGSVPPPPTIYFPTQAPTRDGPYAASSIWLPNGCPTSSAITRAKREGNVYSPLLPDLSWYVCPYPNSSCNTTDKCYSFYWNNGPGSNLLGAKLNFTKCGASEEGCSVIPGGGSTPVPGPGPVAGVQPAIPPALSCPEYNHAHPTDVIGTSSSDSHACFYSIPVSPGTINTTLSASALALPVLSLPTGAAPVGVAPVSLAPGFSSTSIANNTFYGGPLPCPPHGPCTSVTNGPPTTSSGSPYQTYSEEYSGEGVCPYKILGDATNFPDGCPGNMSRLAWYCAFVNAALRNMGSQQRISMMNWDAEGNGPTGLQCANFQFLYAMRQYGVLDDVNPTIQVDGVMKAQPWTLFENGSSTKTNGAGYANPSGTACGYWDTTDINLGPVRETVTSGSLKTYGDMAVFEAAPEFYWLDGVGLSELGNAPDTLPGQAPGANAGATGHGLWSPLIRAGYTGCPQSSPGKTDIDLACGCRKTIYATYSRVDNGGLGLINALDPLYTALTQPTNTSSGMFATPAFSLEHVGDNTTSNTVDFGECINAANFCTFASGSTELGNQWCAADPKCAVRCGVMAAFGTWTEQCFRQFLDTFVKKYQLPNRKRGSVMVYDAGFIPKTWLTSSAMVFNPYGLTEFVTSPSLSGSTTCKLPNGRPGLPTAPLYCSNSSFKFSSTVLLKPEYPFSSTNAP